MYKRQEYDYILKTDADVFLTENLKGIEPEDKLFVGLGSYQWPREGLASKIQQKMDNISRNVFGLDSLSIPNVGASLFGKTDSGIWCCTNQLIITKYLLEVEFKEDKGEWPNWFWGVASMYGMSIAINGAFHYQRLRMYVLDDKCWDGNITKTVYHIHAWQTESGQEDCFNKAEWHSGYENQNLKCSDINEIPKSKADYCKWIAGNTLEELLEFKLKQS